MSESASHSDAELLAGERLLFIGKLAGMPRREAERLVRQRGGKVIEPSDGTPSLIIVSDQLVNLRRVASDPELLSDETRRALAGGGAELIHESELWSRLGLVDAGGGVERLYTPAMLAELVGAPLNAVRQWQRRGALLPKREVRRLAYFDFLEVGVARKLAALLTAGCSLASVNRKLDALSRLLPDTPRPLADPAVVVEGRRLVIRRGEGFSEPTGQLLIDFDASRQEEPASSNAEPIAIPFAAAEALRKPAGRRRGAHPVASEDLRSLAAEIEESGRLDQAIDVYRAILVSGEFTADDHFALAELLYSLGDLSAARERYYVAIELDENFVEARSNLGCVLAEQGQLALAEAAFRGALEYHPDYADAHYHLARLLDRGQRQPEAARHWRLFMNLAPASPWADEARERLAEGYGYQSIGDVPAWEPTPDASSS